VKHTNTWRKQNVNEEMILSLSLSDDAALAYHRLILVYRARDGVVKDDDQKLARMVGFQARRWKRIKHELLEYFTVTDGYLRHAAEDAEMAEVKQRADSRSKAGKRNADARWHPEVVRNEE